MRSTLATVALAGALGLTGIAGAALVAPAVSNAASGDSAALVERVTSIKQALAGLVTDGTLTQAQADSVASTLAEAAPPHGGHGWGRGHHGRGLSVAAEALGLSVGELRAAAREGKTLAEVAAEQGVEQDVLVDALVAAAQERLATAVETGRLTQEQADARAADLETRISESLDEVHRPGGHRPRGEDGPAPDGTATPEITTSST